MLQALLPALLVLITGKWRYQPPIYWSTDSYIRNLFRLYEVVFWRRYGFRAEQSADSQGNFHLHSFEAKVVYIESLLRSLRFEKIEVAQLKYANTPYSFQIPIFNFAWGLVGGQSANSSGTLTATATFTNTPAQGNTIIADAASPVIVSSGVPTITDGNLNALTVLKSLNGSASAAGLTLDSYIAGASQSKSVIATGFTSDTVYVNSYEFSGGFAATNGTASTFIDNAQAVSVGASGSTSGGGSVNVTTTNANDMIVAAMVLIAGRTVSSNNLTILQANPAAPGTFLIDANEIFTSTQTTFSNTFSWTGATRYGFVMVALLPAGGTLHTQSLLASYSTSGSLTKQTNKADSALNATYLTLSVRKNLVPNPSFEATLTDWTYIGDGSFSRSTTQAYSGTYSSQLIVTSGGSRYGGMYANYIALLPNTTYVYSAYLYIPSGSSAYLKLNTATSGGTTVQTLTQTLSGNSGWQRVSIEFTTGSTEVQCLLGVYASAEPLTFYADAILLEQGSTVNSYFDGSYSGAIWTGTVNVSASLLNISLTSMVSRSLNGTYKTSGIITTRAITRLFTASYSAVGNITRFLQRILTGATYSTSGTINKKANRSLAGNYSSSGSLGSQLISSTIFKSLFGTYSTSGSLSKQTNRTLPATYSSQGSLSKMPSRLFSGSYSSAGVLTYVWTAIVVLSATYSTAGSLKRSAGKRFTGTYSTMGTLTSIVKAFLLKIISFFLSVPPPIEIVLIVPAPIVISVTVSPPILLPIIVPDPITLSFTG